MITRTYPTLPAWVSPLDDGLNALRAAAERARTACEGAHAAADALRADIPDPDHTQPGTLYAVAVPNDGCGERHPYTETASAIAFAHLGLEDALACVWHRAARAFAYTTSNLLSDLTLYGHQAPDSLRLTASSLLAVPCPVGDDDELADAYQAAAVAQQPLLPIHQLKGPPAGTAVRARSAEKWHAFADLAHKRIWCQITESARTAPAGR